MYLLNLTAMKFKYLWRTTEKSYSFVNVAKSYGGGAAKFAVSGTFTLNGTITADGGNGSGSNGL